MWYCFSWRFWYVVLCYVVFCSPESPWTPNVSPLPVFVTLPEVPPVTEAPMGRAPCSFKFGRALLCITPMLTMLCVVLPRHVCQVVLCYAKLCHAMSYYHAMSCHVWLCSDTLCSGMFCYVVFCCVRLIYVTGTCYACWKMLEIRRSSALSPRDSKTLP